VMRYGDDFVFSRVPLAMIVTRLHYRFRVAYAANGRHHAYLSGFSANFSLSRRAPSSCYAEASTLQKIRRRFEPFSLILIAGDIYC